MNITRHNYEEFFLLYVDDELTAAERSVVETFIAANPDLKQELELLQQSTFTVNAKLDDAFKNSLLKPVEENAAVTEEQLLLFIDDELKADEAATVKQAVAADAHLQQQLQWLQRSKLSADASIVFPDKSLLYKESQPTRVFYMNTAVRRWSAAAAVLLLLGTGYWLYNRQEVAEPLVINQPEASSQQQNLDTNTSTKVKSDVPPANEALVQTQESLKQPSTVLKGSTQKQNNIQQPTSTRQQNNTIAVNNNQQQIQAPVVQQQENNSKTDAIVKTDTKPTTESNNSINTTVQPSTNIAASTVSYVNNDEPGDEDEQEGLLNENRQRSTGLKALLKRAKRTLERRTGIQSGDSQVRFAVFSVNTQ